MKLGVVTPVVVATPGASAEWEKKAGIAEVAKVAEAAESLGYYHLTCSEHVVVPKAAEATRGSRYWDPLATFGYLAARTSRIRLATHVVVLGYHHPLAIAKRYGTLDQVCNGRLILGVGVGSLAEEFGLLGARFEGRGELADDAIRALRASMSHREPSYSGSRFRFADVVLDPCAAQERVPIWIGGRTRRSLSRAVELGDAWMPFGLSARRLEEMLVEARRQPAWETRPRELELVLWDNHPLDPIGDRESVLVRIERFRGLGATHLDVSLVHDSLPHYLDQLAAMAELVAGS